MTTNTIRLFALEQLQGLNEADRVARAALPQPYQPGATLELYGHQWTLIGGPDGSVLPEVGGLSNEAFNMLRARIPNGNIQNTLRDHGDSAPSTAGADPEPSPTPDESFEQADELEDFGFSRETDDELM